MTGAASFHQPCSGRLALRFRREEIETAERSILRAIERHGYEPACVFAVRLSLQEALNNAFRHGNKSDPKKVVRLEWSVEADAVVIDIEDEGEGFDPGSVPDPTEQENVEIPSGRGLKLIQAFMTEVRIHAPGNRVHMRYERPG